MTRASIPLESAYLCLDCNAISDDSRQCPACASGTVASLSGFLNREEALYGGKEEDDYVLEVRLRAVV
jgi:hypothetical protein